MGKGSEIWIVGRDIVTANLSRRVPSQSGCHYFTTRPWPDGDARGEHEPPGAILTFCRSGLGTTEEVSACAITACTT